MTQAEVNGMGEMFDMMQGKASKKINLRKTKAKLTSYNSPPLRVRVVFRTEMSTRKNRYKQTYT